MQLIESGGGRVLDRNGTDWSGGHFVIPRQTLHPERVRLVCATCIMAEEITHIRKCWGRQPLQVNWLMDSIASQQLFPEEPYVLPECSMQSWLSPPKKKHEGRLRAAMQLEHYEL